ncbi:MAG TPA: hypothetical protein VIE15_02655, partial [Acidimicrobiales bacterium]
DRGATDTVVLTGGHCTYNPEPLADFVDAAILGDGEEVVTELNAVVAQTFNYLVQHPVGAIHLPGQRTSTSHGARR